MSRDMTLTQLLALSTERPRRVVALFMTERALESVRREAEAIEDAIRTANLELGKRQRRMTMLSADAAQLRRLK